MILRTARTIKNYLTGLPDVHKYTRRVTSAIDFASFAVDIQHDLARPQLLLNPETARGDPRYVPRDIATGARFTPTCVGTSLVNALISAFWAALVLRSLRSLSASSRTSEFGIPVYSHRGK